MAPVNVGKRRAARTAALVAASCWLVASCAPTHRHAPLTEGGDGREIEAADSLDAVEDALAGASADDRESVAESIAEAGSGERAADRPRGGGSVGPGIRPYVRAEGVTGYRSAVRAEAGWRGRERSARVGARRYNGLYGGFVELRGWGPVRRLTVGGLRPRLGEGVLLGVRYSPFVPTRGSPVRPGLSVSPTTSIWDPKIGAAAEVGLGTVAVAVAGWRESGTGESGQTVCWASLSKRHGGWLAGVAGGGRASNGRGWANDVDASVFAGWNGPSVTAAGELARFQGRVYAALRAVSGEWRLEAYNGPVPSGFSNDAAGPDDVGRQQWGGALHRTASIRGTKARASLYACVRRTAGALTRRRRYEAVAGGRTGAAGRWEASVRISTDSETSYGRDTVDNAPEATNRRYARGRVGWTGAGAGGFRQQYRIAVHTTDSGGVGTVTTIGWGYARRWIDASFVASNYSMAPGQTGYVVRPGIAGYEIVSAVTRTGSDLSARLRLNWHGVRLRLYWGHPWSKDPRRYASLAISL